MRAQLSNAEHEIAKKEKEIRLMERENQNNGALSEKLKSEADAFSGLVKERMAKVRELQTEKDKLEFDNNRLQEYIKKLKRRESKP